MYARLPTWVVQGKSSPSSQRRIHTVIERTVTLPDRQKPSALVSLNIHDRKGKVDHKQYDRESRNAHFVHLAKIFQLERVKTELLVLVAETTIFRLDPNDSKKFNVRGGHISAALVTLPPLEDKETPIIVEWPISKLPGGKNKVVANDSVVDGKSLAGQNFEVSAHFESPKDYVMYRDSNLPIDRIGGNSAPVLFAALDLHALGIDYEKAYKLSQQLATNNPRYVRLGNACGEFVLESFGGKIPTNANKGMATQLSFALTIDHIAKSTRNHVFADALTNALREIKAFTDPQKMCELGDNLKQEYQARQASTNNAESLLTVKSDNDRDSTENHEPIQGGPKA